MAITAALTNAIILAETGGETAGNPLIQLVPFLLIGLVFYFLIIRPQRKRQADQQALLRKLDIGDEVVTIGGFHGEILALDEDTVELEISRDVVVTMARNAIARTITPAPGLDDEDFDDSAFDDDLSAGTATDPRFDDATLDDRSLDDTTFDDTTGEGTDPHDGR